MLFADPWVVAVSKPAGMLVHRGMGADRSETFRLQAVRNLVGVRVHAAHRLDRPTCGVVLFATSGESARRLQESWMAGEVRKRYLGVVRGWMPASEGVRDEPLDDPETGVEKPALTRWRGLGASEIGMPAAGHPTARFSLLELEPSTGRWHQLRRHLSRMAHPLVGDTVHGDRRTNHALRDRFGWWRLLLWARSLEFPHPSTGERTLVEDPGPGILPFWERLERESIG